MRRECRERFPHHRGLAIPTCITARAWPTCRDACRDRSLAVSFEVGGGENVSGKDLLLLLEWTVCHWWYVQNLYFVHQWYVVDCWVGINIFILKCVLFSSKRWAVWHTTLVSCLSASSWWRHQMEIFSALLVLCVGNSPVNSPHKGQWRGALVFSSISFWTNGWVSNRGAGDLRRHRAHYDVTVMYL